MFKTPFQIDNISKSDFEEQIRHQDTETAGVFTPKGDLILRKNGDNDKVSFTDKEIAIIRGNIYTHNHPNGSWLSSTDLNFAIRNNLAEMRAVVSNGTYILKRSESGWPSLKEFNLALDNSVERANQILRTGKIVDVDFIPLETAKILRLKYSFQGR